MVLPYTPLVVFPDVEGVIITAGWGAGDNVADKWSEIDNWEVYIYWYVLLKSKYHYYSIHGKKQSNSAYILCKICVSL